MKMTKKKTILLSLLALVTVCGTASATASTWKAIQPSSGMPMLFGTPTLQATLAEGQYFRIEDGTRVSNIADAGTRTWKISIPVENNEVAGESTTVRVGWTGYKSMAGTKLNGRVCSWNSNGIWISCTAQSSTPPHDTNFYRSADHYVGANATVAVQFEMGNTDVGGTKAVLHKVLYQQVD